MRPVRAGWSAAGLLVLTWALPGASMAQGNPWRVGGDALLTTRYVWRGVERTNGLVLQPDAYLAIGLGGQGWITAGGWGNETGTSTPPAAQFDSPLSLWITVWQRQLVHGTA
jgi:hypothetical protein